MPRPIADLLRRLTGRPTNQQATQPPAPTAELSASPSYSSPAGVPEPVTVRKDPATTGWKAKLESVIGRVTGNRYVVRVMAVMTIANEAGAPLFSAALAFSTMFAIIPIVLLLAGVLGWVISDPTEQQALLDELIGTVPPLAGFFESTLQGIVQARGALSLIGVVGLLWGASAYYAGLDEVMRRIFVGGGIRDVLARRARGLITIVILIALIVGTISLGGLWAFLGSLAGDLGIWRIVAPVASLLIMILIVLAVYRLVPTAPPSMRAAALPATVAGIGIGLLTNLFGALAPVLVGGLSGLGVIASLFGALIWLNLSYQILLFGAAWARLRRDREADKASIVELAP